MNKEQKPSYNTPFSHCKTFQDVLFQNATVYNGMKSGKTAEDTIVILVNQLNDALKQVSKLESIAPKRITVDGRDIIWRCPDYLIPSSNLVLKT